MKTDERTDDLCAGGADTFGAAAIVLACVMWTGILMVLAWAGLV